MRKNEKPNIKGNIKGKSKLYIKVKKENYLIY